MSAGSITYDEGSIPLGFAACAVGAFRVSGGSYTYLPSVLPLQVESSEGPDPGTARFRYVFSDEASAPEGAPTRWDDVYQLAANPGGAVDVLRTDDRIAVIEYGSDGVGELVFDGFVLMPELHLDGQTQAVAFQATGTPARLFDTPLPGAICRDCVDPHTVTDVRTDLPARFNPDGRPNASPSGADAGSDAQPYPTFLDPLVIRNPDLRRQWTVAMACRYLLGVGNPDEDPTTYQPVTQWVENPDFSSLDALLDSRKPVAGQFFDPSDSSTYTSDPLVCQDLDVRGKLLPEALELLLRPHGFAFAFRCESSGSHDPSTGMPGPPKHTLEIYRKADAGEQTEVAILYQAPGQALDPSQTNTREAALARDASDLANQIRVVTDPARYEIGAVLAPLFPLSSSDTASGTVDTFTKGNASYPANADKYRAFGLDEAGDGHWDGGAMSTDPPSLDDVFGDGPLGADPAYVRRRRPIAHEARLFSIPEGVIDAPKAELWISTDYPFAYPGLYSAAADSTWQRVQSGWELLKDRFGIRITVKNPARDFNIGSSKDAGAPYPSGLVNLVAELNGTTPPVFRLVAVVESDRGLVAVANRRPVSPTSYTIERCDEARDRWKKEVVDASSPYAADAGNDQTLRDDTKDAQDFAEQRRLAHELGPVAGSFTVPDLSLEYRVGDRVVKFEGRQPDVSLAQNLGESQGEAAAYPSIVRVTRNYDGEQSVTCLLSDRRGEPPARRRR